MKAVIIGAGRVGRHIAEHLSRTYGVTVVDRNPSIAEELQYSLDVTTVEGDATLPETLKDAGVGEANYVIATTDDDHVNIIVCSLTKTMSDAKTIARVKSMDYLKVWSRGRSALGVDLMVCTVPLVVKSIINVINFPELRLLRNIYGPLYAGEALSASKGIWNVELAGRRIIIGTMREIEGLYREKKPRRILIMGGSETSLLLAAMLSHKGYSIKLVERDHERTELASKKLDSVTVVVGDVFNPTLWELEELDEADIAVASLGTDEGNLLASILARKMGVERVFSIVREGSFIDIFEKNGIVAVSPERVTAERIVLAARGRKVLGVVSAIPGITVLAVKADDVLGGKTAPGTGIVPGPVLREGEIMVPTRGFHPRKGDIMTFVVENDKLGDLNL